jgi:hypothetical protein
VLICQPSKTHRLCWKAICPHKTIRKYKRTAITHWKKVNTSPVLLPYIQSKHYDSSQIKNISQLYKSIFGPETTSILHRNISLSTLEKSKQFRTTIKPTKKAEGIMENKETPAITITEIKRHTNEMNKVSPSELLKHPSNCSLNSSSPFCKFCPHCNSLLDANIVRKRLLKMKTSIDYSTDNTKSFIKKVVFRQDMMHVKSILSEDRPKESGRDPILELAEDYLDGKITEESLLGNKKINISRGSIIAKDFLTSLKEYLRAIDDKSASFFYELNEYSSKSITRNRI